MKMESFKDLVEMVQGHPVFNHDQYGRGCKQAPPAHQLMVFL